METKKSSYGVVVEGVAVSNTPYMLPGTGSFGGASGKVTDGTVLRRRAFFSKCVEERLVLISGNGVGVARRQRGGQSCGVL